MNNYQIFHHYGCWVDGGVVQANSKSEAIKKAAKGKRTIAMADMLIETDCTHYLRLEESKATPIPEEKENHDI